MRIPKRYLTLVPCVLASLVISQKLDKDYQDWQVEALENLDGEDRKLWTNAHPNDCPRIAIGHFESKIDLSYALLLVAYHELITSE
jgi:hypothetical protein